MIIQTKSMLPSTDLERTADFYKKLGFKAENPVRDYMIMSRDGQEIHFFMHETSHYPDHSEFACYIRVKELLALYDEFRAGGLAAVPPIDQPWGMQELYLVDPDGSLLRFGEAQLG